MGKSDTIEEYGLLQKSICLLEFFISNNVENST